MNLNDNYIKKISRPLKGTPMGKHVGLAVGPTVFEFLNGQGLNITSYEGFASGEKITIEEVITDVSTLDIYKKVSVAKNYNYNFFFFNCEAFVNYLCGRPVISMQVLTLVTLSGLIAYIAFGNKAKIA